MSAAKLNFVVGLHLNDTTSGIHVNKLTYRVTHNNRPINHYQIIKNVLFKSYIKVPIEIRFLRQIKEMIEQHIYHRPALNIFCVTYF